MNPDDQLNASHAPLKNTIEEPFFLEFLRPATNIRRTNTIAKDLGGDSGSTGQLYISRCNISVISNYLLYLVFITTTIFYLYFAARP